ncbi:transmembrane protein [Legionella beliardensis]|uniref:Transmembrane protein n=1 Tax=Legionella beliardensis TaxID=91822 RepID=A0A378I3D9_9GAMM|nr:YhdP family protein [Legionella beliardensis]STX29382.1 transmembrane protein [Legionella beliardensis]
MRSHLLPPLLKFFKRCWLIFAILVIALAIMSSLFRVLTPWAKQYKPKLEQRLTMLLGEPVTIQKMETGWFWFEPVIKLKGVTVQSKNTTIYLKKFLVGINLFESLRHWQLQPGILYIDDLNLTLRQIDKQWQIDGLTNINKNNTNLAYEPVLSWVLAQQKIVINNLNLQVYLKDETRLPLRRFNLKITNHSGKYTVTGNAYLAQTPLTSFRLLADMTLNPYKLNEAKGRLFFAAKHLQLTQWDTFLPSSRMQINDGKANLLLWLDWQAGHINQMQANVELNKLAWQDKVTKIDQHLPYLFANLAWHPTEAGWQLAGNNMRMQLGDIKWPKNEFLLNYNQSGKTLDLYVKNLILESLLPTISNWPEQFNPILAVMPQGLLQDVRLTLKDKNPTRLLTKFSRLSWLAQKKLPGMQNLSGALYWQPNEGRLELNSYASPHLNFLTKPSVAFDVLAGSLNWQVLAKGVQINLHRLTLIRPDLKVNAEGSIQDVSAKSAGQIDLTAQILGNNAEQWLTYLPKKYLKPKLDVWLKHDVKRIKQVVAKIAIHGRAADFPFDKQPGEFTIRSYLQGVDLSFAPNWPLVKDINGYLNLNKRLLDATLEQATTKGFKISHTNLRVPDIGLDKETLLLRTQINTTTSKALDYVHSSPLAKKLSALNILKMKGDLDLSLQLEVPFYSAPGHDHILALGDLVFKNNQVLVNHIINDVQLDHLAGSLQFDEQGILSSNLKAATMDCPVNLVIQSVRYPKPYTEVKITATTTSQVLRNKFNLPWLSLLDGEVGLEGILTITNDPDDLDHLQIKTSLAGMAINLPPPLGKTFSALAPLTIDVNFNPKKAVRLRIAYNELVNSDLWFSWLNGKFQLERGEIRLGNGQALWQEKPGLQVVGTLSNFNLQRWQDALAKIPFNKTSSSAIPLRVVDILLKQAKIGSQSYPNLNLKATKIHDKEWLVDIKQKQIAAKLHYQEDCHRLSGHVAKLILANGPTPSSLNKPSALNIKDIPNLDLTIEQLQFNTLDLGKAVIKTTTKPNKLQLDSFKLSALGYDMQAKGEWRQKENESSTFLQGTMEINDLAKALQRLKISPALEAHRGNIQFTGQWPGGFHDFSLKQFAGDLHLLFKDGRITNLSPETEEKLGMGKLLSILSLQTIPRRLKLDFSDLAQHGYSFDEYNGAFKVNHGLVTTQHSYIDGPVAYASMKGNLDVVNQRYNLDLEITPHITASLPIVATIAGGPVIGFATWIASTIINHGMQKISGYTYKISGPWKKPLVQQVNIIKKVNLAYKKLNKNNL